MSAALFATLFRITNLPILVGGLWRDRRGHWDLIDFVLVVALLLGIAVLAWFSWFVWKQRRSKGFHHPRKLFQSLCIIHKLDSNQQKLLMLLAQHHQLPQPAALFLDPDRFKLDSPIPTLSAHAGELLALQQRLFASSSQASQTTPATQKR